jgi:hypothetical protein
MLRFLKGPWEFTTVGIDDIILYTSSNESIVYDSSEDSFLPFFLPDLLVKAVVALPATSQYLAFHGPSEEETRFSICQNTTCLVSGELSCPTCYLRGLFKLLHNDDQIVLFSFGNYSSLQLGVFFIASTTFETATVPLRVPIVGGVASVHNILSSRWAIVFDDLSVALQMLTLTPQVSVALLNTTVQMGAFTLKTAHVRRTPFGGSQLVFSVNDRLHPTFGADSVQVLTDEFCESDLQCAAESVCNPSSSTCVQKDVSFSCPLPRPAPQAVCIDGSYIISTNYTSSNGSTVVTVPLTIVGSLTLANGTSLIIQTGAFINVSDCIQPGGNLILYTSTTSSGNVSVIQFGGGYCGGVVSTFNSTTVISDTDPNCKPESSDVFYGPRSIVVVYTFNFEACNKSPSDSTSSQGPLLSTGAIAGIIVAAIVLVMAVIAIVLFTKLRGKVMPFSERRTEPSTHELDDH